ncbi:MAG: ATP-dependent DNA helicase [Candidatus Saccharimonas sp.]
MNTFASRYKKLNDVQKQAVDLIDGPLLVIAGPGTGKTELLSMRTANILKKTDTLPENILCLTFTDSGANAMRERLADIIGADAYKVAIHTFHSFGTEVIGQNAEYFYRGARFEPADDLHSYEILRSIFDELDYDHPLASKMRDNYTHLDDTYKAISELKQAGLTSDELLHIIDTNDECLDLVEAELSTIFAGTISLKMLTSLAEAAQRVASFVPPVLPKAITPLVNVLALSLAHMYDEATVLGKTKPITAWRNQWMEKNDQGIFVFKDRKRQVKLRAVASIYFAYLSRMEHAGLYDYDDMILNVVHGMESQPELRLNLQEKYHYIMVDEFQDTNLAQLRILFDLTQSATPDAQPNIMAVGDDDQAIYSFQGADVNNIHRFREQYPSHSSLVLIDNYRSTPEVLSISRDIILQGSGRLETTMDINKSLTTHVESGTSVALNEFGAIEDERAWLGEQIAALIAQGTAPSSIAVLARRHKELISLLPHLYQHHIDVNYERRDNVLEMEPIKMLERIVRVCVALADQQHELADSLLPELLSHEMYGFSPESIWRLSLASSRNHLNWIETMLTHEEFKPIADWLITRASRVAHEPLEEYLDIVMGIPDESDTKDVILFKSPYFEHYFSKSILDSQPDAYITVLEALRTIRDKLRSYQDTEAQQIGEFLEFIDLHREMGAPITSLRRRADASERAINLMTAHKSKGLEFDHVFIVGAVDSSWGERVRGRSRLISYPENLPLTPAGASYDERLRLFFVATTRAKRALTISYPLTDDAGKATLPASFLVGLPLDTTTPASTHDARSLTAQQELLWHERITNAPTASMRQLLAPVLETYKLSSTHLNNFIDITRGGPAHFLMNNLLRFPQAKSANAAYGTAIHAALSRAHGHLVATGERRPVEDVLGDFQQELQSEHLSEEDTLTYGKRGIDNLRKFLTSYYDSFTSTQKSELSFAGQGVMVGEAKLTGSLDLLDLQNKTITVTDYKTGKPSRDWKGASEFEKIKLHKYKQQLLFYQLLCEHSRDYRKYVFGGGVLQFVEPTPSGTFCALDYTFTNEEKERFIKLLCAVWHCITTLELPDISEFEPNYKGILAFEDTLIDKYSK